MLTSRWDRRRAVGQLDRLTTQADTYQPAVDGGATFHNFHERKLVGTGKPAFHAAGAAILSMEMHRRAGLRVVTSTPSVSVGDVVVLGFTVGPLQVLAPCRVAQTWDSPSTAGFGYVTLPGHPECGYEKFVVEHTAEDAVFLEISSQSRSSVAVLRLFSVVNRLVQARITRRYQQAIRSVIDQATT